MEWFRIHSLTASVDVQADNWLAALGVGLGRLGVVDDLTRIACETLPNGNILVRDARTGAGFSVGSIAYEDAVEDEPTGEAELATVPEELIQASLGVQDYTEEVAAAPDVEHAVARALGALRDLAPSEAGSVLRRHSDGWLSFEACFGPGAERLTGVAIPPNVGVAGFSVARSIAVSLKDAYADPRFFRQIDTFTGFTTRSLLSLPLVIDGLVYGCIQLVNAKRPEGFTRDAIADADQIALVLAARLAREPVPTPPRAGAE